MQITRIDDAPSYSPPLHHHVDAVRLQGMEASATKHFWVGLSRYGPDAHTDEAPTQEETVYVVLDGELIVSADAQEVTIGQHDSVHLPKGTPRRLWNRSDREAVLLVIIAQPTQLQP